ncbi:AraC family transcriptional regulator [Pedobacter agri]|uniref:AraC family transcriptional regulator n=1 Tax=Pedobacter agri TaxID=454586 RepID=UPI00292EA19C|nr:AraC family transcriptional regulator [Pedobacter agri]
MENITSKGMSYFDVLFTYFSDQDTVYHNKSEFHFIMYVMSGKMTVTDHGKEYVVQKGESVFVKRDHRISFTKSLNGEEPYKSVTLKLSRNKLRQYFQDLNLDNKMESSRPLATSVKLIKKSTYLDSLFLSLLPFFETDTKPRLDFVDQKMNEGIAELLSISDSFYPTLFDFAEPWKIDIIDFLDENYMYDLTMDEIASYTGRSLATFKRDFAKVSDVTPQKWLINKRLEIAYDLIKRSGTKVNEVYNSVGFKNRSHFSLAFKRQYGFSPGDRCYGAKS